MIAEIIQLNSIATRSIRITNQSRPSKNEPVQLEINRSIKKNENNYTCVLKATMQREIEKDVEEKSFFVEYVIEATFECINKDASIEELQNDALISLIPHLRAGIASVLGAAGIDPILIPPFISAGSN